jgi:integral membrane sensor domain MASE1
MLWIFLANFANQIPTMKLRLVIGTFVLLLLNLATATSQLGEGPAAALNSAIIYLALAPFAIVGYLGWRWWKNEKKVIQEENS